MKTRHFGLIITVATATLFAGCATGRTGGDGFSRDETDKDVKVFITNLAFMDATVYGHTNGGRRRLGRVTGKREVVFSMPLWGPSEMYLEIDLLAGPTCFTERIIVGPGDHLELIIQNDNMSWTCRGG